MIARPRPLRSGALLVSAGWVIALMSEVSQARAEGTASVVAVLGFHGSRLADEIKRELESSGFEVLSTEIGTRRWQDTALAVDGGRLLRGVAVDENDRTLTVYTRAAGTSAVDVRLALSVDPADRMARRHACLSVVELLHALSENEPPFLNDRDGLRTPGAAGGPAGSEAHSTATSAAVLAPPGSPPRSSAAGSSPPDGPMSNVPPALADFAPAPGSNGRAAGWQVGVGTTFDLETHGGGPTSHLQFLGRIPATPHLALCVSALWPLLASQSRRDGNDVRGWTFGASASLQYTLTPRRRLQPYVGLGLGTRLGLTETTPMTASQSRESFTVSGTFGVEAGVRTSLGPLLQMFFELSAARAWIIPPDRNDDIGRAAANGESARATVGVLFES